LDQINYSSNDTSIATVVDLGISADVTGESSGNTYIKVVGTLEEGVRVTYYVPVEVISISIGSPGNGLNPGVFVDNDGQAVLNSGRCSITTSPDNSTGTDTSSGTIQV